MTCEAPAATAILSVRQAARHMPMSDAKARALLDERGLVRDLAGRRVVIWGQVLDALTAGALAADEVQQRRRSGRARGGLR